MVRRQSACNPSEIYVVWYSPQTEDNCAEAAQGGDSGRRGGGTRTKAAGAQTRNVVVVGVLSALGATSRTPPLPGPLGSMRGRIGLKVHDI